MKKRALLLFFAFLLCISLVSCNGDNADETTAPVSDVAVEETQPTDNGIVLFAPGVCEYRIVYPSDDTDDEFNAARKLQSFIEEKCGVKPEIMRSKNVSGDKADPSVKEILLSYVDFDEFDEAIAGIPYNVTVCAAIGNKIVITGHEREGFKDAFENFMNMLEKETAEGKCVLPSNLWSTCDSSNRDYSKFKKIPGYPGGMIEDFSELGDRYYQVTIYDTDADMYADYEEILAKSGYSLYSENEMAGNFYSTYTKEEEMLYYYYSENTGETRVIIADNVSLPSLAEVEYKQICEPAYISIKSLDENGKVSGDSQGGVIRFADGSFMIYDGGNNNNQQAKQIYDVLTANAPDPNNIVVRAWVFSHFHGDHVGAFQAYVSRYKNVKNVTIESFIYNFCNTKEQTQCISAGQMTKTTDAIFTLGGGKIPVYKCLTGQIYRFPGMDMEILACMSDFIPLVIGFERSDAEKDAGDGNSMSTVVRLKTPEGNTCMLTGDSTNIVLDDMVDRYGAEYLDSDIVTTPHHAHNRDSYRARNATIKFYDAVKPEILVVTSPNMSKFTPGKYPYEVNVHVIKNYDPEIYMMDSIRLINLATLKEIK